MCDEEQMIKTKYIGICGDFSSEKMIKKSKYTKYVLKMPSETFVI